MLLVLVTVTTIAFFLNYYFSVAETSEINKYSESSLKQISFASDLVYNQVVTLSSQLEADSDIVKCVGNIGSPSEEEKVLKYRIFLKLRDIQAMYPFISSIGVYRLDNKAGVDTENIPLDPSLLSESPKQYLRYVPRRVQTEKTDLPKDLITFIFFPGYSKLDSSDFAVVINVDQGYLLDIVTRTGGGHGDYLFLVVNASGTVLASSDQTLLLSDYSHVDYVRRALASKSREGHSSFTERGYENMLFFVKSDALDWCAIAVTPYNTISSIFGIRNVLFLIVAVITLVGCLIAVMLAHVQYNPMQQLLEKFGEKHLANPTIDEYKVLTDVYSESVVYKKSAELYIQNTSQYTKSFCLSALLKGSGVKPFKKELLQIIRENFNGPCYRVVLVKLDRFAEIKSRESPYLLDYAIQNILLELLGQKLRADFMQTEENELVFLLQFTEENSSDELKKALPLLQKIMRENFGLSFSAAVSETVYDSEDLHAAYQSAAEFIKYRLFYGHGCVLDASIVQSHLHVEFSDSYNRMYKRIVESVRMGNADAVEKYVGMCIRTISKASYYQAIAYCTHLASELALNFSDVVPIDEEMKIISQINHSETLETIAADLCAFCESICRKCEEQNRQHFEQKNLDIVETMENHVDQSYDDPDLSLEKISRRTKLSSAYLGKLFKHYKGVSFNEYLTAKRLEKAQILLKTTDDTVSSICKKVGIYNVNYFFTLYRKAFGITPTSYRKSCDKSRHSP